jgi:hypothetical protein
MAAKRSTLPGDVVLVYHQGRAASFARVEEIRPHGRPGWFLCDLLILAVPTQPVTWILERGQIDGADFTMGGEPVRIERLPDLGTRHAAVASTDSPPPASNEDASARSARRSVRGRSRSARGESLGGEGRADKVVPLFPRK